MVSDNRYQKWIDLAKALDSWRPFPRFFIATYLYLLYISFEWFISLEDPSTQQAGLISVIVGAGAAWFSSYVNSKKEE